MVKWISQRSSEPLLGVRVPPGAQERSEWSPYKLACREGLEAQLRFFELSFRAKENPIEYRLQVSTMNDRLEHVMFECSQKTQNYIK